MNMASFAGNIGFKVSCQLQSRVPSISSRFMWKSQYQWLKSRDSFISYVPFRYISKTYSKVTTSETALLVKSLEKSNFPSRPNVSVPKMNGGKDVHGRIAHSETSQNLNETHNDLLFDDNEQGCEQMEEVKEDVEELTICPEEDFSEWDFLKNEKVTYAEESAIKLLAARAVTTVELRKKLHAKRFSPDAVEAVINKFQGRGVINDRLYAEAFTRSRWSSSSWGPRRIKQALFKKGVSQADAEKAVELVFKDNDSDGDQKSIISLSKHSMDHLYAQASKQWLRGKDVLKETRKARIVRWLQYRGFDWDVISFILTKLDRQDPP